MREEASNPTRLQDYAPPAFLIDTVFLEVELDPNATRVRARLTMRRNPAAGPGGPLALDGEKLRLESVLLDGAPLGANRYQVDDSHLTIADLPDAFTLETVTRCDPAANTALTGLYQSNGIFCTQCEAQGFRRITYFLDRPDVMAVYRTRITGDAATAPVMLSNGNLVDSGTLPDGRHFAEWHDPFKKPSYLFALVAGDLGHVEDRFVTASGRAVTLRIYVEPGNEDRCGFAMAALKRAMRWDEERFGREYDLDIFMIVAVSAFNMGAMENKGLNVFNDKYILARPDVATDADYAGIETVVAHEYFHNWTGNRITCRDWFQLCLKEGLTVFRDQEFTADTTSRAVKRIEDVRTLRARQFPEDQGPLAHPVRPESYIEINNFYTPTIYEKGAEVVRMIATLAGRDGFRRGMDLYFARHDGEAATVEDFVQALADGGGLDLDQFRRWYSQSGTPQLAARGEYDAAAHAYTLDLTQTCPPTPGQPDKAPFHIPVAVGLIGPDGADLPLRLAGEPSAQGTTRVLSLRAAHQRFHFLDVPAAPVPSLLRDFSAPVELSVPRSEADWILLMTHDSDPFNRWEAIQKFATARLIGAIDAARASEAASSWDVLIDVFRRLLDTGRADPSFAALALALPSEPTIAQTIGQDVDVDAIHAAREALRGRIGAVLRDALIEIYDRSRPTGPYEPDPAQAGLRSLRNACLTYLAAAPGRDGIERALAQFAQADNMTDSVAALAVLANVDCPERQGVLDAFYDRWRDNPLVLDKWFAIQAMSTLPDTLGRVVALTGHPAFTITNPNRVRALIASFAGGKQARFHAADGAGYRFIADRVLELDPLNPQVAARLLGAFKTWRQFDAGRRARMAAQLERIAGTAGLSRDVYEIASKTLI